MVKTKNDYLRSAAEGIHRAANNLQGQAKEVRSTLAARARADKNLALKVISKGTIRSKIARYDWLSGEETPRRRSALSLKVEKLQQEIMASERAGLVE